ncbi:plasmid mobilization relaxosome protein MobC [Rhizobium sp. SL86]|nr:plasmid mobilization relaxosome protein MobC [Rhizobium sp. SL86]MCY1667373.1 plasmid mobilization relaxosome protein MobC [Rhizobium sp. SL86]
MRKVGVNLNQVAKALNSGRFVHLDEAQSALRDVQLAVVGVSVELRNATRRSGQRRREVR